MPTNYRLGSHSEATFKQMEKAASRTSLGCGWGLAAQLLSAAARHPHRHTCTAARLQSCRRTSPNIWEISGEVMKSPAVPNTSLCTQDTRWRIRQRREGKQGPWVAMQGVICT